MIKNILFGTASGYGNLGDDAYKHLFSEYLGEKYTLHFDSPYPDLRNGEQMDAVVIGGGGLIYNNSTGHFEYMRQYMDLAVSKKLPLFFLSCGVQIVNYKKEMAKEQILELTKTQLKPWVKYLQYAKVITVRSEQDADIIKYIAPNANVFYIPDLVYLIKPAKYHLTQPKSVVFVLTRSSVNHPMFKAYWHKYTTTHKDKRYCIAMAADDYDVNEKYAQQIDPRGNYAMRKYLTPAEASRILSDADIVVTGRYHGKIMSLASGKPENKILSIDNRYKSVVEKRPQDNYEAYRTIELFEQYSQ